MTRCHLTALSLLTLTFGCTDPLADLDLDGVADRDDNCPEQSNDEQIDTDADGWGDACDLTVQLLDGGLVFADADAWTIAAVPFAEIANFTDEAQPYAVWSDSDELVPEQEHGVVEPGEIRTIYLNADARGIEPGAWLAAGVHLETDEGVESGDAGAETVAPPPPGMCSYMVKRDFIRVDVGEGGAHPALELSVSTSITFGGGLTNAVTYVGTVATVYSVKAGLYGSSVASGTAVSHPWNVDVTEYDPGPSFDNGAGASTISFTCVGTGSQTDEMPVALGTAQITVGVKATW